VDFENNTYFQVIIVVVKNEYAIECIFEVNNLIIFFTISLNLSENSM